MVIFCVPSLHSQAELIEVEVLDVYQPLASVRAKHGKPFMAGLLWPMRTEYRTVKTSDIRVFEAGPVEVETPTGLRTILANVDNASFPITLE
jgi:hypothetical protein